MTKGMLKGYDYFSKLCNCVPLLLHHICSIFFYFYFFLCFVCRWFEAHHQAEAVGPAGGAGGEIRVAPWGSRVLRWLPTSYAGAGPREKSQGCRVLAPPLARPLVDTLRRCTSHPSHFLKRLQQITFHFGHIRWIFIYLFFFLLNCFGFIVQLLLLCMFALYLSVLLLTRPDGRNPVGFFYLMSALAVVLCLTHVTRNKTVIVLLVNPPCLLHSCTKTQTNQGYVAFLFLCSLRRTFFSLSYFSLVLLLLKKKLFYHISYM